MKGGARPAADITVIAACHHIGCLLVSLWYPFLLFHLQQRFTAARRYSVDKDIPIEVELPYQERGSNSEHSEIQKHLV